jgi:hypothetical protein
LQILLSKWSFKMRHVCKSAIRGAAFLVMCLALSGLSAKAEVFDFSFSPDAFGTFNAGAAASDPGFELITGLTFDVLSATDRGGNQFSLRNAVASDFQPGAAFNPTTRAFLNHFNGQTFSDIGAFAVQDVSINGMSFGPDSTQLSGLSPGEEEREFSVDGSLAIIPAKSSATPEPQTWVMLVLGFGGLGYFAHRRSRKPTFA